MEKNEHGGDRKSIYQNDKLIGETAVMIGKQVGLGQATVERAAKFTEAVDKIVSVTGIKVNDLLDDKIKGTMDDIKTFADLERFKSPLSQNGMFFVTLKV